MQQRLWHSGLRLLALAIVWSVALAQASPAQEPPKTDEPPAADKQPATAKPPADASHAPDALPGEQFPQVYQLRDGDGKLQSVPGLSYEDFVELWKLQRRLADENRRPAFSIQSLVVTGTASVSSAEVVAKATIAVHEAGWVGVPLRLNDAKLREPPAYAGPGDHVLDVQPDRDGFVVWIRGQADQTHEVTLRLMVPLHAVGPQSRLQLSVPSAAVSQLQLQVPLARAAAKVSEGSTLDTVRPLAGGKTELKVIGLGGDFELSWHPADSQVATLPVILDVNGEQTIHMRGRSVSTEATLTVRSLGSAFDRFQVRLPPGADYVGPPEPGVSLVAVDASAASGKLYEVTLPEKSVGPIDVRLVTERAHNTAQGDEMLQLAGFEVLAAKRQGGKIDVDVEGNWQIVWGQTDHVRPVDDAVGQASRNTRFEYFGQPYSLAARVVPQKIRVRVVPEYVLLVESEEARLQARLKYTIRGAKAGLLEIGLPGWEVDEVGPATLVDTDAAIAAAGESLVIPLLQPTTGDLELTFEAHRKIEPGAGNVKLELPRPQGDVVAADVAVTSDDNVELVPLADEMVALAPQSVRAQMKLPERQQDALYYRTTGDGAQFVAAVKLHQQDISAALTARLDVGPDDTRIDQRLAFQIAYLPTDHLTLNVPRAIRPERLTVLFEGQRIVPVSMRPAPAVNDATSLVRVNLPAPRIGRCELQINYAIGHEQPRAESSALVNVPLVVPGEGRLTANRLAVVPESGIAVSYPPGPWTREKPAQPTAVGATLALAAERAIPEVTLGVSSKPSPTEQSTIVERAWIRTQLTGGGRQDRATFRLSTGQTRLAVRLPGGADVRSLVVEVDSVPVAPESIRQREVTIPLADRPSGDHVLEMRYNFTSRAPRGSLALEGPQLTSANWVEQLYWQLVLPEDEQMLFGPSSYAEELTWVWGGFFWQRRPTLSERDLETWIGATSISGRSPGDAAPQNAPRRSLSAGSNNRFLFSTAGSVEPLELYTLSRARLVLIASLPLLVCGLTLIYFSAARHPAALFALAVLLAAGTFVAPQSALVLAQASALGLALAGVAVLLARMLPRPAQATIPVRGSSQALRERTITGRFPRPAAAGTQPASTATDPLVPTSGEVEP